MAITADSFENPPPSTLDKAAFERVRRRKSKAQASITVQKVSAPRQEQKVTVTPIKTPATEENVQRATENPQQFAQEAIRRDRNRRISEQAIKNIQPPKSAAAGTPGQKQTRQEQKTQFIKQRVTYTTTVQPADNIPSRYKQEKQSFIEKTLDILGKDTSSAARKDVKFTPREAVQAPVFITESFATGFGTAAVNFGRGLTVDIDKTLQGVTDVATGKTTLSDISEAQRASFIRNPFSFAGATTFDVAGTNIAARGIRGARNVAVRTGSTYIPEEIIVSEQVTSGKVKLPRTRSTAESLKKFNEEAGGYAITASPQKIAGKVAGESRKSQLGFEDPGIYTTPISEASPYFLKIGSEGGVSYSLNPLKPLQEALSQPTFTVFKTRGARTLPRRVSEQPGFEPVREYFEQRTPSGELFITKRSQIGTGDVKARAGESGTRELEAVVPPKQSFTYTPTGTLGGLKGYNVYTRIQGQNIPIRFTELIDETRGASVRTEAPGTRVISGEQVLRDSSRPLTTQSSASLTPSFTTSSLSGLEAPTFSQDLTSFDATTSKPPITSSRVVTPPKSYSPIISPRISVSPSISSPISRTSSGSSGGRRGGSSRLTPSPSRIYSPSSSSSTLSSSSISSSISRGGSSASRPNIPRTTLTPTYRTTLPRLLPRKERGSSFTVQVFKKGKFLTVGRRETRKGAIGLGSQVVGGSELRSFRVLEKGKAIQATESRELRKKKRDPFTFVERSAFAINTPGEVLKIPGESKRRRRKGLL